ncbi:chemotaxis protein CheB [Sorangium sp. So ce834]|uniref:chemotaxis protein CheB n=1 Tax=Sorangium sp. So ce834 TaxID=3133321 RepID=UPI003F5DD88B
MNQLGRASLVFLSSLASIALAGCSAESVDDPVSEEGELGSAQSALCDIEDVVPHDFLVIDPSESVQTQSPSGAYHDSNCTGGYVVDAGSDSYIETLHFEASWEDNGLVNQVNCSTAHVDMDIYGYDLDDHEWKAASDVAPVNGQWSATNGCQVRIQSHLGDVLRRRSELPVRTVASAAPLEDGVVYIVPPGRDVEITDHELRLQPESSARPKPSVDTLFRTAAEVFGENLVAIVLTGTTSWRSTSRRGACSASTARRSVRTSSTSRSRSPTGRRSRRSTPPSGANRRSRSRSPSSRRPRMTRPTSRSRATGPARKSRARSRRR